MQQDDTGSQTEAAVLHVFAQVLRTKHAVRADDNFFALGGDSIGVMTMLFQLHRLFGVEISPGVVFDSPTPADIARVLNARILEGDGTDQSARVAASGESGSF